MKINAQMTYIASGGNEATGVVTIGDITVLGNDCMITFTDATGALFVTKRYIPTGAGCVTSAGYFIPVQLCTSAYIVS
jgi:hypothetical protein